jgi:hypothetical protein
VYLSDQWGCPDDTPLIGVPFYLADPIDRAVILEQLEARYSGWQVTVENNGSAAATFLARKVA